MELTTDSLLCHSQLPLAAQSLGTQLPGASASLGLGHLCLALIFPTPSVPLCGEAVILCSWERIQCPPPAIHGVSVSDFASFSSAPLLLNKLRPGEGRDLLKVTQGSGLRRNTQPIMLLIAYLSLLSLGASLLSCPWLTPSTMPGILPEAGNEVHAES